MQEKLRAAGAWLDPVTGDAGRSGQGRRASRPHSPAQRQLAQAPHAAGPEHVLLRARPVQHGAEAERHVGAPARGAHLEQGAGGGTPGKAGWSPVAWRKGQGDLGAGFFAGSGTEAVPHLQSPGP